MKLNLGDWDNALLKSLSLVGIGIAISALFNGLAPTSLSDIQGLIVTFLLYIGVYLLISIIGWLVIGFPIHWLVTKYTKGSYFYYIALPLLFVVLCLLYKGYLLLGLAAFFQALIFRFFVYRKE